MPNGTEPTAARQPTAPRQPCVIPEPFGIVRRAAETCKLNHVNPQAYFTDLLTRLVNGWPQKRIDELMPWFWAPPQQPP
jgi:hypothetical protein